MHNDTLRMDEGINLQPCIYAPQVHNNDLYVVGSRSISNIGHIGCTFVLLCMRLMIN